jgi:DNA ligase (NAD+)
LKLVDKLFDAGIKIEPYYKQKGKLAGLVFAITGTLDSMSRQEAKERIRELGGTAVESVSKNTDYVVAAANPGSKKTMAQKLGVKILNEEEFKKTIS